MGAYEKQLLTEITKLKPVLWQNEHKQSFDQVKATVAITHDDIIDASDRLQRFAPLIKKLFPETGDGIIESPLVLTNNMKQALESTYNKPINGTVYVKCDSHLQVAGSVKARGGIYEVLKLAEKLVLEQGLLAVTDDYAKLAQPEFKRFFSQYQIAVGSTGNLGLSIGIISAALGFKVTIHMSRDAKQWKKDLLRNKGAVVVEHSEDYSQAVAEGRRQCANDPNAYFVDDENSKDLFLGYSVAALRLAEQFEQQGIVVDNNHPLYVYLPCGVGGAPGGIAFGLKYIFGDNVHCYFVEPTHSPCMLLGLLTGKHSDLHVKDYGLDNVTEADGLAVGSPSKFVSALAEKIIDGIYTIEDSQLFKLLALLKDSEEIKLEPSAAAGLLGPVVVDVTDQATHLCWATGGLFLPDQLYQDMYHKGQEYL